MIILENRPEFLKSDEDILSWISLDEAERRKIIAIYKEKQADLNTDSNKDCVTYSQLKELSEVNAFI